MNMRRMIFYAVAAVLAASPMVETQGQRKASQKALYDVCGNPGLACKTSGGFGEEDLPIKISGELDWMGEYKSKPFFAIILQSRKVIRKSHPAEDDYVCAGQFSAGERANVQKHFPDNRVFSSAFGCYHFEHLYTNVNQDYNFLAVYGGTTRAAATVVLKQVKALREFPDANIRRIQAVLCNICH